MIPKIEFRYSSVYDFSYKNSLGIKKFLKKHNKSYPERSSIIAYMGGIEKIWARHGNKILREISKVSGLKWKEKKIICYLIGVGRPFSDPLTINIINYKDKNDFIDTLTHELIHQIQTQDSKKWPIWWNYINKKFKDESMLTRAHISVQAIHARVILNLFDEKRLKKEIKGHASLKKSDYDKAWKIIKKEGYDSIIKEFRNKTK